MSEIDPDDGLPYDLDAELDRLRREAAEQEAEDRAEFAHLYAGEWMSTSEARATLIKRGSSPDEAAGSLIRWLISNDGRAPHLRARAERAVSTLRGPKLRPSEVRRDTIVHGWEWDAEISFADWGSGTFDIIQRVEDAGAYRRTLLLYGVQLSKDDFERRIGARVSPPDDADAASVVIASSFPAQPTRSAKRVNPTSPEWLSWVSAFKKAHSPLPDVDRIIFPAARKEFGDRITQALVRRAFGGKPPGPRNST